MKTIMKHSIIILALASSVFAKNSIVINEVMYQKQKFDYKNTIIFETDKEGLRVWNWKNGQKYCKRLKLDGFKDWRVASKQELLALMSKAPVYNTLYVKKPLAKYMPEPDVKYHDVWFWSRDSKKPNLGAFVNFKKANSGWADKKYKGYILCTRDNKPLKSINCKGIARQEISYSKNWLKAWSGCGGYIALKRDGSLWEFGKIGYCYTGITPIDYKTGKPLYKKRDKYYLKPKKIGSGFRGAKFFTGGYRFYAIKKDGTLWGWGVGIGRKAKKIGPGKNWKTAGIRFEGNGCCAYDMALKKDGTLWRFGEGVNYKKEPNMYKIASNVKGVKLRCCKVYIKKMDNKVYIATQARYTLSSFKVAKKSAMRNIKSWQIKDYNTWSKRVKIRGGRLFLKPLEVDK